MAEKKKIGILGGTFDPFHNGHLRLAQRTCEMYDLDKCLVMPNATPPHKPGQVTTSYEDRYEMTYLAVRHDPRLEICDYERDSSQYHYTYQTLLDFHQLYPDSEFYFILGADSIMSFQDWVKPEVISANCVLVAAIRDHLEEDTFFSHIAYLKETFGSDIRLIDTPNMDISSTMIRRAVLAGESIEEYVDPQVAAYIMQKDLYGAGEA